MSGRAALAAAADPTVARCCNVAKYDEKAEVSHEEDLFFKLKHANTSLKLPSLAGSS
jgi:hypothetical protein